MGVSTATYVGFMLLALLCGAQCLPVDTVTRSAESDQPVCRLKAGAEVLDVFVGFELSKLTRYPPLDVTAYGNPSAISVMLNSIQMLNSGVYNISGSKSGHLALLSKMMTAVVEETRLWIATFENSTVDCSEPSEAHCMITGLGLKTLSTSYPPVDAATYESISALSVIRNSILLLNSGVHSISGNKSDHLAQLSEIMTSAIEETCLWIASFENSAVNCSDPSEALFMITALSLKTHVDNFEEFIPEPKFCGGIDIEGWISSTFTDEEHQRYLCIGSLPGSNGPQCNN